MNITGKTNATNAEKAGAEFPKFLCRTLQAPLSTDTYDDYTFTVYEKYC